MKLSHLYGFVLNYGNCVFVLSFVLASTQKMIISFNFALIMSFLGLRVLIKSKP